MEDFSKIWRIYRRGGDILEINLEVIGVNLLVKLHGEIDHHTSGEIREAIDRKIGSGGIKNLIFDFSGVTFMDSSGVGLIIGRYKQIKLRGGRTMIVQARPNVERLMEITGIKKIIDTNEDIAI